MILFCFCFFFCFTLFIYIHNTRKLKNTTFTLADVSELNEAISNTKSFVRYYWLPMYRMFEYTHETYVMLVYVIVLVWYASVSVCVVQYI